MSEKDKKEDFKPMLPQILTMIRQPNRVTTATYDYTLTQQRVLLSIMKSLQNAINEIDKGGKPQQLSLFRSNTDSILLSLSLKDIAHSKFQYDEVKEAVELIANIPFKFSGVDPLTGVKAVSVGGLFRAYIPEDKYRREITIEINKDIAYRLISIGEGWTKFAFEIAYNARNKYTPRLYQLISRWKDKGGVKISLKDFREWLAIGDKYPTFKDLKKRIIDPVKTELYEKADCWFEVGEVERTGRAITMLNFKILTRLSTEAIDIRKNNIIGILRLHFGFKDEHIKKIGHLLNESKYHNALYEKAVELQTYFTTHPEIENIPNYTVKSLLQRFKETKK